MLNVLKNSTLAGIQAEIAKQNEIIEDFVNLYAVSTWDVVQANVRTGKASQYYDIGDELICNYHDYVGNADYDFPWVDAEIDRDVVLPDGTTRKALILNAKYATLEEIQFDAAEGQDVDSTTETTAQEGWHYCGVTGTTYTLLNLSTGDAIPFSSYDSIKKCGINDINVLRYGYNRYKMSAQRQWLNSDAEIGEWWEAQHFGDVAPSQLATRPGFLKGLDDDFLAVINPVKVQVAANTVTDGGVTDIMYDKFWLTSLEEMYGVPQAAGVEGAYFPYWKEVTGLTSPSNGSSTVTNDARKIKPINAPSGSAVAVRLRSAYRGSSTNTWYVSSAGYLATSSAYTSYGALPACAIF